MRTLKAILTGMGIAGGIVFLLALVSLSAVILTINIEHLVYTLLIPFLSQRWML